VNFYDTGPPFDDGDHDGNLVVEGRKVQFWLTFLTDISKETLLPNLLQTALFPSKFESAIK
jgi:hypothetical protein